jgi:hypothetical protein
MALETWYAPGGTGTPSRSGPIVGPGDPSGDYPKRPDPWNVLRFLNGYLTIDTEDKHYPDWHKWLQMSASSSGLRIVDTAEMEAALDPDALTCSETLPDATNLTGTIHEIHGTKPCEFRAKTTKEIHQHMLKVHRGQS